jgi:hypothetical protein
VSAPFWPKWMSAPASPTTLLAPLAATRTVTGIEPVS